MSNGNATLHELETVYSVEDVYLMLELASIDAYNQKLAQKKKD
jgi:hypothetical protein